MSRYRVYVTAAVWREVKALLGPMRQRVRKAIDALADNPRPAKSQALDLPTVPNEVRRLRLDRWRLIYTIHEDDQTVDVLAVRKRPPYDYGDLTALLGDDGH